MRYCTYLLVALLGLASCNNDDDLDQVAFGDVCSDNTAVPPEDVLPIPRTVDLAGDYVLIAREECGVAGCMDVIVPVADDYALRLLRTGEILRVGDLPDELAWENFDRWSFAISPGLGGNPALILFSDVVPTRSIEVLGVGPCRIVLSDGVQGSLTLGELGVE